MAELHETLMGRRLIEGVIPDIAQQLERIANTLEKKEKNMAEITRMEDLEDKITVKGLLEFLEYEEASTTDKATATRIRVLLINLGVWTA